MLEMFPVVDKSIDDIQLIQCVKDRPELYDSTHVKYMDTNHKNALWNEIGDVLQVDSSTCKSRWCNIRDNYRKSLKKYIAKRNRGAKIIKHYKYAVCLQFLKKFFDDVDIAGSIGEGQDLSGIEMVKQEDDSYIQLDTREGFSDDDSQCQSPVYDATKRLKCELEEQGSSYSFPVHYGVHKAEAGESKSSMVSPHLVDAFLAGCCAPTLKTLSPIDWHHAKSEIFAVVQKYELKTITGKEGNVQSSSN